MGVATRDDQLYLLILVVSFGCSLTIKRFIQSSLIREYISPVIGISLVAYICGQQLLYSVILVALNLPLYMLLSQHKLVNTLMVERVTIQANNRMAWSSILSLFFRKKYFRNLPIISFGVSFAYLTFTRCAVFFGLPQLLPHANAIQLVMTLKVIALAFDIRDCERLAREEKEGLSLSETLRLTAQRLPEVEDINCVKIICYLYNYAGLFTGPFYPYRIHLDSLKLQPIAHSVAVIQEMWPRVLSIPMYAALIIIVGYFFPLKALKTDEFYEAHGWFYRFAYMSPVFYHLKSRMFIAWMLAESTCIAGCIGAYPNDSEPKCGRGPTKLMDDDWIQQASTHSTVELNFESVRNIDPYNTEFSDRYRDGMRAWNRSVQFWLANYVYARAPKSVRMPLTMFVSAFWHGVHPGYYLSFLTIPLCTAVEDAVHKQYSVKEHALSRAFWWFIRQRGFEFMSTGFLLLSWSDTMRYWSSIGFTLHVTMIVITVITLIDKTIHGPRIHKSKTS